MTGPVSPDTTANYLGALIGESTVLAPLADAKFVPIPSSLTLAEIVEIKDVAPPEIVAGMLRSLEAGSVMVPDSLIDAIDRSKPDKTHLQGMLVAAVDWLIGISEAETKRPWTHVLFCPIEGSKQARLELAKIVGHVGLKLKDLA